MKGVTTTTTRLAHYRVHTVTATRVIRKRRIPYSGNFSELIAACAALRSGQLADPAEAQSAQFWDFPVRPELPALHQLVVDFPGTEGKGHEVVVTLEPGDVMELLTRDPPRSAPGLMGRIQLTHQLRNGKAA